MLPPDGGGGNATTNASTGSEGPNGDSVADANTPAGDGVVGSQEAATTEDAGSGAAASSDKPADGSEDGTGRADLPPDADPALEEMSVYFMKLNAERRQENEHRVQAARTIQVWWRGCVVKRLQLLAEENKS